MFDIGALELLVVVIVAIIVIGPKDMPQALRAAGRWVGKIRRVSAQFRSGFDAMVREAELEEMEKKWQERNARIMADTPQGEMEPLAASQAMHSGGEDTGDGGAEEPRSPDDAAGDQQPSLPLDNQGNDGLVGDGAVDNGQAGEQGKG